MCFIAGLVRSECEITELAAASNFLQTSTGLQMPGTAWETGTEYSLSCKPSEDQKHQTWTNNIRALTDVDQTKIDL